MIFEEIRKVASLLWENGHKGRVHFDHPSYDYTEDIPHIVLNGRRIKVDEVLLNRRGDTLSVSDGDVTYVIRIPNEPSLREETESFLLESGIDTLVRDIYYETGVSWETGDFESDFMLNGNTKKSLRMQKTEAFCQAALDLYADRAGLTLFDQECDLAADEEESDHPLFSIMTDTSGTAKRYYCDGVQVTPLFMGDIYDDLIVGMVKEMMPCEYE